MSLLELVRDLRDTGRLEEAEQMCENILHRIINICGEYHLNVAQVQEVIIFASKEKIEIYYENRTLGIL